MTSAPPGENRLHYRVREGDGRHWFMDLEDVPETPLHDLIIELLVQVMRHHFRRRDALVARNLGCRWDPEDARVGMDPDVVVVEPAPPERPALSTLRVWLAEHPAPRIAVEVVSEHNADEDYFEGPLRLARLGGSELWIFDPELRGPATTGGPFPLQVWRRRTSADAVDTERIHAGDAPAYSPELQAWIVTTDGGQRLRVADDADGAQLWPTPEEAANERAEAESKRAEAAEAELRRLRATLEKK